MTAATPDPYQKPPLVDDASPADLIQGSLGVVEEPTFLTELPPGSPLPDRVNVAKSRSYKLLPGETDATARKRLHDAEFGESST
jgi:hypothetical protein